MSSTRKQRLASRLEDQFVACDKVMKEAISRIIDEEFNSFSQSQTKVVVALARVSSQMASTIARLDGPSGGEDAPPASENGGSIPQ